MIRMILLSWWLSVYSPPTIETETPLTIRFDNIQTSEGYVLIGIYEKEESWKKRKPEREINIPKQLLIENNMIYKVTGMTSGVFGIAALDDANGNNHVDIGFIFPTEGFGFSNYYVSGFILPGFKDFNFSFPLVHEVEIRFRYL